MTVGSPRSSLVASFSRTNLRVNLDGVSVSPSSNFWSQNQVQSRQKADFEEEKSSGEPQLQQDRKGTEIMSFHLLPYDLLLNIASYLEYVDVHVLQLTCKSLYYSFTTRPVYRKLATDLLRRCRPLPLKGFQRPGDLSTNRLIYSVNKAHQYEHAWLVRAPRPIGSTTAAAAAADTAHGSVRTRNNYLDLESPAGSSAISTPKNWYKVVRAPPGEEVDWLSPITSSYTLCATKSGKVVCWDVQSDTCLAEWNPGERWELWKCRVEFEDKMVYFTMAKVLHGSNSYDDSRVMEFSLMRLQFYENALGKKTASPTFSPVTSFKSVGVVMNIFLLDPSARLLSAFVWVSNSNTIGLYVLLDWEKDEYVFIDTGIECVMSSNWSCILFERNIVIHCEDSDAAFQHFYPLTLLESHSRRLKTKRETPTLSGRVTPFESIVKRFTFPAPRLHSIRRLTNLNVAGVIPITVIDSQTGAIITVTTSIAAAPHTSTISSNTSTTSAISSPPSSAESSSSSNSTSITTPSSSSLNTPPPIQVLPQPVVQPSTSTPSNFNPNPFPFPPWYPESAHFVRQWWPTLSNVPRISCTVVLLASHDPITHKTRFVLAQHYFRVPMRCADWVGFGERGKTGLGRRGMHNPDVDEDGADGVGNNGVDGTSNATYASGVAATAGSSSSSSSTPVASVSAIEQSLGPMEMYFLDGPPEGSVVAPFYEGSPAATASISVLSAGVDTASAVSPIGWTVNGSSSGSSCHSSSPDGTNSSKAKGKGRARTAEDEDETTPSIDSHSRVKNNTTVEDDAMRLWYVSIPFEVVCLEDPSPEDEDGDGVQERPRPLVAVDFGHAVWIEYYDQDGQSEMATAGSRRMHNAPAQHHVEQHQHDDGNVIMQVIGHQHGHIYESVDDDEDKDSAHNSETDVEDGKADDDSETATATDPEEVGFEREESSAEQDEIREQEFQDHKRLRFVTFPPFTDDGRVNDIHGGWGGAEVRTLEIPPELDLHSVETINIDQSQGAIILSVKQGRIFILCYE